jgi:hypothetical protein
MMNCFMQMGQRKLMSTLIVMMILKLFACYWTSVKRML